MGLAGRLESRNEGGIVLANGMPTRVACKLGVVERICLELSHRLSLPDPCRWWAASTSGGGGSCRAPSTGSVTTSVHGTRRGTVLQQLVNLGWIESKSSKSRAVQSLVLLTGQAISAGVAWVVAAAHDLFVCVGWEGFGTVQSRFGLTKRCEKVAIDRAGAERWLQCKSVCLLAFNVL